MEGDNAKIMVTAIINASLEDLIRIILIWIVKHFKENQ